MNACMSSPSFAWCPSTDMLESHSSPDRIETPAWADDFTPGTARRVVSSCS